VNDELPPSSWGCCRLVIAQGAGRQPARGRQTPVFGGVIAAPCRPYFVIPDALRGVPAIARTTARPAATPTQEARREILQPLLRKAAADAVDRQVDASITPGLSSRARSLRSNSIWMCAAGRCRENVPDRPRQQQVASRSVVWLVIKESPDGIAPLIAQPPEDRGPRSWSEASSA